MSFWQRWFGGQQSMPPQRPDYFREGLALAEAGQHYEALTSFRLALRDDPDNVDVLLQIAIAYTRLGLPDEAIRTYRRVLQLDSRAPAAHYGLAFLLLQRGAAAEARAHLRAFLENPPPHATAHIEHARRTLAELVAGEEGDA